MLAVAGSASDAYTWVWLVVGLLTLGGGGGIFGLYRWAKNQGVDDDADRKVRAAVLGTKENGFVGMEQRLVAELNALRREIRPNGGHSQELGDTVHRIENNTKDTNSKLDEHIGWCKAEHDSLGRRIQAVKESRPT